MNTIYRIVCFQNGRVYVGRTFSEYEVNRRETHFSALKHHKHYSQKLQADYDLFGRGAFFFEVLERNVPGDQADLREKHWIAYFRCVQSGYNTSPGVGTTCIWNGVTYTSYSKAARANGYWGKDLGFWVRKGYVCDDDIPLKYQKPRRFWFKEAA